MDASLAPFPSITKTWHNKSYPAISPTRVEVSTKGKSVFITGGGTGIGAAVAYSFAQAGSRDFALAGRTHATLSASAERLRTDFPDVNVLTLITDVTKQDSVNAAFDIAMKHFGNIDVCISNAGYSPPPSPVATIDIEEWRQTFEVNVIGTLHVSQAFLKYANAGAYLLNTSSCIGNIAAIPGYPAYTASKAAGIRLCDMIAAENPAINVFNIPPGLVATNVSRSANNGVELDVDDGELSPAKEDRMHECVC
jgi:NAD(P)-dependent dehydrogenase (short-subunit alcohol dehydrogenase family)